MSQPFVSHVSDGHAVNWSDELEELHEESSRTHFIDVWTRRNRRRYGQLRGDALAAKVKQDIARTTSCPLGELACRIEEGLLTRGVRLPFGIRGLTVLARPRERQ